MVVLRRIRPDGARAHDSQRRSERAWTARECDERTALVGSSELAQSAAARAKDRRSRIIISVVRGKRGFSHPSPDLTEAARDKILLRVPSQVHALGHFSSTQAQ